MNNYLSFGVSSKSICFLYGTASL